MAVILPIGVLRCKSSPTSPLGLGGLEWGVCFQPLFFQPFWFQPSGEGFTPPPTPAQKTPPLLDREDHSLETDYNRDIDIL